MNTDQLWNLFYDTGDPVCWLYYTAAKQQSASDASS